MGKFCDCCHRQQSQKLILGVQGLALTRPNGISQRLRCVALLTEKFRRENSVVSPFVRFSAQTLGVKSGLDREGLPS